MYNRRLHLEPSGDFLNANQEGCCQEAHEQEDRDEDFADVGGCAGQEEASWQEGCSEEEGCDPEEGNDQKDNQEDHEKSFEEEGNREKGSEESRKESHEKDGLKEDSQGGQVNN